tara:strand:- start:25 stop:1023 length:999 start_codon:yes stop_codon:yes gene_type:complete
MYKIKQKPSDFIVKEINNLKCVKDGPYAVFILDKIGYNTIDVIQRIAKFLKIKPRQIGYAGNKDKNAMTTQLITVERKYQNKLSKFKILDRQLVFKGYSKNPLFLGDLIGNEFGIFVRNLTQKQAKDFEVKYREFDKVKIINFFGEQRFSKNNADVGKAIIKGDFKLAIELISSTNNKLNNEFHDYLGGKKNDYVGALKLVPDKLLKLFVHAYQSFMWNDCAKQYIGDKDIYDMENIPITILGFGSDIPYELETIYDNILSKEQVTQRDFIIKSLPHLSQEGAERDLFVFAEDLSIGPILQDKLNKNKFYIKILFRLQKGCYATEVIKQMFT